VAVAAGVWVDRDARTRAWWVGLSAAWLCFSSVQVVPRACFVREIRPDEIAGVDVQRCAFLWRQAHRVLPPAR
jgi:hypothetical protein